MLFICIIAIVLGFVPNIIWDKKYGNTFISPDLLPLRRKYKSLATFGLMLFLVSFLYLFMELSGEEISAIWLIAPLMFMTTNRVLYEPYYTADIVDKVINISLYLRPFDLTLSNKNYWAKGKFGIDEYLEKLIGDELNKRVAKFYCIGDPDAAIPTTIGASCIYASDDNWKISVETLLERSKVVVLRVMNTEGCLWEMRQCTLKYMGKTIFLIDSDDNLKVFKDALAGYDFELPEISINENYCTALFLDDKQINWNVVCLSDKRSIKAMVSMFIDSHLKLNQELQDEKQIKNILTKPFKSMSISSVWSHRISVILQPLWYMVYNRWPLFWKAIFVLLLLIFIAIAYTYNINPFLAYFTYVVLWAWFGPRISVSFNSWGSDYLLDKGNVSLCKWVCVYCMLVVLLANFI